MTPGEISSFVQTQWFSKAGLWGALVAGLLASETLLVAGGAVWWVHLVVSGVILMIITFGWFFSRRPPKAPKDKIGFLVSITSDSDEESMRLREDFLVPLQQLIKSGTMGTAFHFMRLPQHLAEQVIDQDAALEARIKSRAHFMLYGRSRRRDIGGEDAHVINLEGIVVHKETGASQKSALEKEFTELLPRAVQFGSENDMVSFEFTSQWTDIVAKYVIGIAAALSGSLDYAESLYLDAQKRLKDKDSSFHVFKKLQSRIPIRISELYEARAFSALNEWREEQDPALIDALHANFEKIRGLVPELTPRALLISAISIFLRERDVESAIVEMKKIKQTDDPVWHYNMAFLKGYQGNLKVASREYEKAIKKPVEPEAIGQIEDFICWVIEEEPEQYQLHFCLGIFNRRVKGDYLQAISDFRTFLKYAKPGEFVKEHDLARQWIAEMEVERPEVVG